MNNVCYVVLKRELAQTETQLDYLGDGATWWLFVLKPWDEGVRIEF